MLSKFHKSDKSDKVVMNLDVPVGFAVQFVLFAHLDTVNEPQEGGAVKFFQMNIVPDVGDPVIGRLLVLLTGFKLGCDLYPLLLLFPALSLVGFISWTQTASGMALFTLSS